MNTLERHHNLLNNTVYGGIGIKKLIEESKGKTDGIINLHNTLRIILSEYISARFFSNENNEQTVNKIQTSLLEKEYPGISLEIRRRLIRWINSKRKTLAYLSLDLESYIKGKVSESPESFITSLIKELELDFHSPENMGLEKSDKLPADIPIQAKQANKAGVPGNMNGTIGVLKNELGDIVSNPRIIEVIKNSFGLDLSDQKVVNFLLSYHPGPGMEVFRRAMELLIEREEEIYDWPKIKGAATKPYFVPGGGGGLTAYMSEFVEMGDLFIIPNLRWPNIDGIVSRTTKVPPATTNMIMEDGSLNFDDLENMIDTAISQGRKKVHLYLNFPNNPTGVRMSNEDKENLNTMLSKFKDESIDINILLDDPYGAFSYDSTKLNENKEDIKPEEVKLTSPISYHIDTTKNVTLCEVGSHGTKEAGVYGLRSAILRVFTSKDKVEDFEQKLNLTIRETFSMSNSLVQVLFIKAILGDDIDPSSLNQNGLGAALNKLPKEVINQRIDKYLAGRAKMIEVIDPKLMDMKDSILEFCSDYLISIDNSSGNIIAETGGFMLSFGITEKLKNAGVTEKDVVKVCNSLGENEGIAFCAFSDTLNSSGCIRISLIPGDPEEFAIKLYTGIEKLLKEKSS